MIGQHSHDRPRRKIAKDRRGAIMIVALACLLISMSLLGSMIEGAVRARRSLRELRNQQQTEWLLASAFDRAAYRLASETDYRGETWQASLDGAAGDAAGEVVIEVARDAADDPWQVRIVAQFPAGSELSVRRTQTFVINANTPSRSPSQAIQAEE